MKKNTECSKIPKHKRERNVNFTPQETDLLVSLAQRKRHIIENKKSDATTWQAKEKTWNDIAKAFNNASSFVHRSSKTFKLKYEALKRDTRKKAAAAQIPLTPVELKVKKIIFDPKESNISLCDSDLVVPNSDLNSDSRENIIDLPIERVCEEQEKELQQCKPKQKRGFHKLIQKKIVLVNLQKQLVIEEMEQKLIQRRILETELVHKNDIYNLEKQHLLPKIELLKKDLAI